MALIGVRPKHYRAIVLEVLRSFPDATVWVNHRRCEDLSEAGPLTQRGIARMGDFEIRTEHASILGFHDHPREMWIDGEFRDLAERLADLGHLRLERVTDRSPSAARLRGPLKRFLLSVVAGMAGYIFGAIIGYFLVSSLSSNMHDRSVEAAMTAAFVFGPLGALIAAVVAFVVTGATTAKRA